MMLSNISCLSIRVKVTTRVLTYWSELSGKSHEFESKSFLSISYVCVCVCDCDVHVRPWHRLLCSSSQYQTCCHSLSSLQTRTEHRNSPWDRSTTSPHIPDTALDPGSGCSARLETTKNSVIRDYTCASSPVGTLILLLCSVTGKCFLFCLMGQGQRGKIKHWNMV